MIASRFRPRAVLSGLSALLALALASCETTPENPGTSTSRGLDAWGNRPGPRGFNTVIVDAGHGGKDSGARIRRTGLTEKTLALDMARRLRSELSGSFRVVMTRESDTYVSLDERVRQANLHGDGILVSLHFNENSPRCSGPETYWWRVDSYTLAKRVERNLSAASPYDNNRNLVRRRLRLTRNPMIPCILVECGYLTNSQEAKSLAESSYKNKLARAIASAIREQSREGDGNLGPLPKFIKAPPSQQGHSRRR